MVGVGWGGSALAQSDEAEPATAVVEAAVEPVEEAPVEVPVVVAPVAAPRFPQHFLFGNGLALVLTSLSVGYELLPVAHHSFGLNIHGQYGGGIISEIIGVKGAFIGLGAELGYRFYAWRDGPYGPFLGLSFLTGYYHTQSTIYRIDANAFRYAQYGPAVDFGWSVHLDTKGTVLALSIGAQYTFTNVDAGTLPELTRLLVGDGLRPRGGIQVGKVF